MPRRNHQIKPVSTSLHASCLSKRRFNNESQAIDAAEYQMLENMNLELRTYKCDFCHKWHLTRNSDQTP